MSHSVSNKVLSAALGDDQFPSQFLVHVEYAHSVNRTEAA